LPVSSIANSAYASFEEKAEGPIEPGRLADFVILSQDLMTVPDGQIRSTHPPATYIGGRKLFDTSDSKF